MLAIYYVIHSETVGWQGPLFGTRDQDTMMRIVSRRLPSELRDAWERAKLYRALFPPKDASKDDLAAVAPSAEKLREMCKLVSPPIRDMIRYNLGLYSYRNYEFEAGDAILSDFSHFDDFARTLSLSRCIRQVEAFFENRGSLFDAHRRPTANPSANVAGIRRPRVPRRVIRRERSARDEARGCRGGNRANSRR